jgi:hypothetical protein
MVDLVVAMVVGVVHGLQTLTPVPWEVLETLHYMAEQVVETILVDMVVQMVLVVGAMAVPAVAETLVMVVAEAHMVALVDQPIMTAAGEQVRLAGAMVP